MTEEIDIIHRVIEENGEHVEDYLSAEDGAMNYLIGQVLQASNGRLDPKEAKSLLEDEIHDQWEEPIDWPVELEIYRQISDQTGVLERVGNHLRDRDAPFPENPDYPHRVYPPKVRCKFLVHEDGECEVVELEEA